MNDKNDDIHEHNIEILTSFEKPTEHGQIPRIAAILGASRRDDGRVLIHLAVDPALPHEALIRTLRALADQMEERDVVETRQKGTMPS